MADKVYTAQEMREMADKMGGIYGDYPEASAMLRQAAAAMEREAAKDAELRECLQLAVEMKCANCGLCTRGIEPCYPEGQIVHHEDCLMIMKWRKALEGGVK